MGLLDLMSALIIAHLFHEWQWIFIAAAIFYYTNGNRSSMKDGSEAWQMKDEK
jgi:hypothetical protein